MIGTEEQEPHHRIQDPHHLDKNPVHKRKSKAIAPSAQEPTQRKGAESIDRGDFSGKSEIGLGFLQIRPLRSDHWRFYEIIAYQGELPREGSCHLFERFLRSPLFAAGFSRVVLLLTSAPWCACLGNGNGIGCFSPISCVAYIDSPRPQDFLTPPHSFHGHIFIFNPIFSAM
jgi:hypothetical protein